MRTISTAYQFFAQDTLTLANDKLTLNAGLRTPVVKRDFTNYPNEALNAGTYYRITKSYSDVLPQLGARYRITNDDQLFASVAKNMKAPPSTIFLASNSNLKVINGAPVMVEDVRQETSYNVDVGYRHQDSRFIGSVTLYHVDFRNRQAVAYNPISGVSTLTNVGDVKNMGFEIEAGNTPIGGWAFYTSFGYSKSEIGRDLVTGANSSLPTAGKEMPLTPRMKAALSAEYQQGAFWARLKARATSKQQATLVNDEEVPGYTLYGFDAGYTFANYGLLKRPKLTFNLANLTNKQYRNPSSQSVTNAQAYPGIAAKSVFYYLGAPRFASLTLSVDI